MPVGSCLKGLLAVRVCRLLILPMTEKQLTPNADEFSKKKSVNDGMWTRSFSTERSAKSKQLGE